MNRKRFTRILIVLASALLMMSVTNLAYASEATTSFGSESYATFVGEEFPIGVYINSDALIGHYEIDVRYDNTRLEYLYGGDSESNGVIHISGEVNDYGTRTMVSFRAISGGSAGIFIASATASNLAGDEQYDIVQMQYAPITVDGEDVSGETFVDRIYLEGIDIPGVTPERDDVDAEDPDGDEDASDDQNADDVDEDDADLGADAQDSSVGSDTADDQSGVVEPGDESTTSVDEALEELIDVNNNISSAKEIYEQSLLKSENTTKSQSLVLSICIIAFFVLVLAGVLCIGAYHNYKNKKMIEEENRKEQFSFKFEDVEEESDWRF